MKKIILLLSLFIAFGATAQFLSLKDLIKLQSKNLTDAQEYLAKNDWKFNDAKELKNGINQVSFAYGRNKLAIKKAQGWLRYVYNEKRGIVRISYEIFNSNEFNDFQSDVKRKDFRLINTEVKEGKLISTYTNNTHYLTLQSIKIENAVNVAVRYRVGVKSAADYLNTEKNNKED